MKNAVRTFVVVLALTGATAATRVSVVSKSTAPALGAKATAWPLPTCPPGTGDDCGLGGSNPNPNIVSR